jgi:hypothetical protein
MDMTASWRSWPGPGVVLPTVVVTYDGFARGHSFLYASMQISGAGSRIFAERYSLSAIFTTSYVMISGCLSCSSYAVRAPEVSHGAHGAHRASMMKRGVNRPSRHTSGLKAPRAAKGRGEGECANLARPPAAAPPHSRTLPWGRIPGANPVP